MRFESCLAVLLTSLVVFASGSNDDDDNNANIMAFDGELRLLKHREVKKNSSDDTTQKRSKRSLSSSDRDTILHAFNYQRSLVGASDMNYLYYDTALEADLHNWTRLCDSDAEFYSAYDSIVWRYGHSSYTYANDIRRIFKIKNDFYSVTSVYVARVAGSDNYCPTLTVNGTKYRNVHLRAYGILIQSRLYNDTVQQYKPGEACTCCQSTVSWCYHNLCRGDCALSINGCYQISKSAQTAVCAIQNGAKSGASGIQAIETAILHGLVLIIICYYFQ